MSKPADQQAENIEQRYVAEHAETEQLLEGLDPDDTEPGKADAVGAVGEDRDAEHIETMTRDDP